MTTNAVGVAAITGERGSHAERVLGVLTVLAVASLCGYGFHLIRSIWPLDATRPFSPVGLAGTAAVLAPLLAAWGLMRRWGVRWADYGLTGMPAWKVALQGVVATAVVFVSVMYGIGPIAAAVATEPPDVSHLMGVVGNPTGYLTVLVVVWITAAVMEELLFRGFLLNETARILGDGRVAWAAAAVGTGVVFGLAHAYQGPSGIVLTGGVGVVMGLVYLGVGRRLWPLILAHGLIDTYSITQLFLSG